MRSSDWSSDVCSSDLHTGSDNSDQRELVYGGLSNLPGPLWHFGVAQDGTVWLVGWGRANHAGLGDDDVLRAVIDESYGDYPPTDNESNTDGNSRFYGMEIWYSGRSEEHTSELQSLIRISYAVYCLKKTTSVTNECTVKTYR